mgnify:CR=1 FL=1
MLMSEQTYLAASAAPSRALRSAVIYAAAGWSGFFVMGVELLGGRLLAPYFGSSIFVWGGIIAVFMTCLSIGYLLGGHLSMKAASPRTLGALLMTEGILALPIIGMGALALEWLSYAVPDPRYGSLLGALLLFGAPTIVSGMISPYAVRLLIADVSRSGRSAGGLYFVSTLGSAAGTILTSFYFVLYLEIDTVMLSMIATSIVLGGSMVVANGRRT